MVIRSAPDPTLAERSRRILSDLIRERRMLLTGNTDEATLEANRLAIVYWQQHLRQSPKRSRT